MLTSEIDGYLTYYEITDFTDPWKEPEVVLLYHGLGRTVDVWYGWVPVLARHYRVLRTDCRGHGRSGLPRKGYDWSLANLAREAKLLLDRLALKRVHWAGESLGGLIGMQFAVDYPDRLASLTLCATPYRWRPAVQEAMARGIEQLQRQSVQEWYQQCLAFHFDVEKDDPRMLQWFVELVGRTDAEVIQALLRSLLSVDIAALCPRLHVPTLILAPGRSPLVPVEDARAMQRAIPQAHLVIYEDARHHLFLTHSDACAQEMLRFLRDLATC
ncbi:MAG: alpha/beta hydrolase [Candidatus Tectimicrobiota bacterium]|nr:MAG: alpha/beta hydrolase [Candidatus Tectomicrobia bacterium]